MPPSIFWLCTSEPVLLFRKIFLETTPYFKVLSINTQIVAYIFIFILLIAFVGLGMYLTLLLAYNLFYLKTSKHTVAIFGIFEIFTALIALLATLIYGILISFGTDLDNIDMKQLWLIDLIKSLGIFYGIIFVLIRGFENINKKFLDEKFEVRVFINFKFGHNKLGQPYFCENKTKLVKKIEGFVKSTDKKLKKSNKQLMHQNEF